MPSVLRHPGFRTLFFANLVSQMGTNVHRVALLFVAYQQTQSAGWVSMILIAQLAAKMLLGPLLAPLVDRHDRRAVMIVADLARFGLVACIPLFALGSMPLLLLITFLASVFEAVHFPAKNSAVPDLVPEADLDDANGLLTASDRVYQIGFAALAGVLIAAAGVAPAFWLDSGTYLISALILLALPSLPGRAASGGYFAAVASGLRPLWQNAVLRRAVAAFALVAVFGSVEQALGVALAVGYLKLGPQGFGALEALQAAGVFAGALLVGRLVRRFGREQVFTASILLFGLGMATIGLFPGLGWIALVMFVLGVFNACFVVPVRGIVQTAVPPELRGRVFAAYGAVMNAAVAGGLLLAGLLEPLLGVLVVLSLSGVAVLLVALALAFSGGLPERAARA